MPLMFYYPCNMKNDSLDRILSICAGQKLKKIPKCCMIWFPVSLLYMSKDDYDDLGGSLFWHLLCYNKE